MANSGIIQKLFGWSPAAEILARNIYWRNIGFFFKYFPVKKVEQKVEQEDVSINLIFSKWREWGIKPGDILLVTSSYVQLKRFQLEPEQIIDLIVKFLGPEGTLVMPAFPYYKNMPKCQDYLSKGIEDQVFKYDAKKNFVTTGLLPGTLLRYKGSIRSSFPINSLCAYGKFATEMFAGEWNEKEPLPCGRGSSWEFIANKNAKIVSLGTDLTHSLTMLHVAEDTNPFWPIRNWYRNKKFILVEEGNKREVVLRERHPKWGTLYFAERKLCNDLISYGIMKSTVICGILTEKVSSSDLLCFLNSRNQSGYPYFFIPREEKYM